MFNAVWPVNGNVGLVIFYEYYLNRSRTFDDVMLAMMFTVLVINIVTVFPVMTMPPFDHHIRVRRRSRIRLARRHIILVSALGPSVLAGVLKFRKFLRTDRHCVHVEGQQRF